MLKHTSHQVFQATLACDCVAPGCRIHQRAAVQASTQHTRRTRPRSPSPCDANPTASPSHPPPRTEACGLKRGKFMLTPTVMMTSNGQMREDVRRRAPPIL